MNFSLYIPPRRTWSCVFAPRMSRDVFGDYNGGSEAPAEILLAAAAAAILLLLLSPLARRRRLRGPQNTARQKSRLPDPCNYSCLLTPGVTRDTSSELAQRVDK